MPSPVPERPGWLIRDPYRYTDAMIILPQEIAHCLQFFDGVQTELDLRAELVRMTGQLDVSAIERQIIDALSTNGFLEDDVFANMRDARRREFSESPTRAPAHAGGAYPAEPDALRSTLAGYMDGAGAAPSPVAGLAGIAAPHVSPEGGWQSYRAAYGALGPEYSERTFVILATSHYGEPERFGLTRKTFVTPLGETTADTALVERLAAAGGPAVEMEDFCHSFEHTVELQVIFLQHLYGPKVRIVPILCGPFARSIYEGGRPEADENVRRFFDALGETNARERDRLFWVLGIDMAHMGARYHDEFHATAGAGIMSEVEERDRGRIERVSAGDAEGYWALIQEQHDDLKWCGSAPLYTFLRAVPEARGSLLRYEQWNIDEASVVSFAGMAFRR
jgi:AmmeMemoRadiSam system protein B